MDKDTTTPSASEALQKARELAEKITNEEWSLGTSFSFKPPKRAVVVDRNGKIFPVFGYEGITDDVQSVCDLHNAFPSIHAELEKVTAERDGVVNLYNIMVKKYQDEKSKRDEI